MRIRPASWLAALFAAVAISAFMTAFAAPARAHLLITVDKTTQRMTVAKDGDELFVWPVSTGAAGYDTPSGDYTPFRMEKDHFSKEWDDAPMPHSVFFTKRGHAIHGSTHKSIGRPASHGCVRLEPKNAALLFDLVKQEGLGLTRVVVTGDAPGVTAPAVAKRNAPARAATGFEQSFGNDDVTASVEPRMTPPADIPRGYYAPPSYGPPREDARRPYRGERRAVIGYRDTRTGQVYYYDRPRYEVVPPRYYYER
jgi:hypothetical protein